MHPGGLGVICSAAHGYLYLPCPGGDVAISPGTRLSFISRKSPGVNLISEFHACLVCFA